MKYTAIVPTMLKSIRFPKLIEDLQNSEYIDEVIIIDNSTNTTPSLDPHPKQKYICEKKNTGCNPAWNKGVRISKYDRLLILNDDIWFDWNILETLGNFITEANGIIGMSEEKIVVHDKEYSIVEFIEGDMDAKNLSNYFIKQIK